MESSINTMCQTMYQQNQFGNQLSESIRDYSNALQDSDKVQAIYTQEIDKAKKTIVNIESLLEYKLRTWANVPVPPAYECIQNIKDIDMLELTLKNSVPADQLEPGFHLRSNEDISEFLRNKDLNLLMNRDKLVALKRKAAEYCTKTDRKKAEQLERSIVSSRQLSRIALMSAKCLDNLAKTYTHEWDSTSHQNHLDYEEFIQSPLNRRFLSDCRTFHVFAQQNRNAVLTAPTSTVTKQDESPVAPTIPITKQELANAIAIAKKTKKYDTVIELENIARCSVAKNLIDSNTVKTLLKRKLDNSPIDNTIVDAKQLKAENTAADTQN